MIDSGDAQQMRDELDELLAMARLFILMAGGNGLVSIAQARVTYEVHAHCCQLPLFEESA